MYSRCTERESGAQFAASCEAILGGINADVFYAGTQSQYAGLDQVNVLVPTALTGQGEIDLLLTVDGKTANGVRVNVK